MVDFGKAFKRPFDDLVTWVIGIILALIPIVNFLTIGFYMNCAATAKKKDFKLPKWENWVDLFVKGLIATIIMILYFIPTIVVVVIGIVLSAGSIMGVLGSLTTANTQAMATSLPTLLGALAIWGILAAIVLIISVYVMPAAVVRYAVSGKFGDAFSFGAVWKKAMNMEYFVAWLVGMVYSMVLGVILAFVPIIGTGIASFTTSITMYTMIGEAASKVSD